MLASMKIAATSIQSYLFRIVNVSYRSPGIGVRAAKLRVRICFLCQYLRNRERWHNEERFCVFVVSSIISL